MLCFKLKISKIIVKYKTLVIYALAISLLAHIPLSYTEKLYIVDPRAQGKIGYYFVNTGTKVTPYKPTYDKDYYTRLGLLSISATSGTRGLGIEQVPGTSVYGILLVNQNQPTSSGKMYLTVNGMFSSQFNDDASRLNRFAGILNDSAFTSDFSSSWLMPTDLGFLSWGPFPRNSFNIMKSSEPWSASLTINSYTLYASGSLLPGKYVLKSGKMLFNRNSSNSEGNASVTILTDANLGIRVLRQCTLIADKPTAITFDNQIGLNISSPKLLNTQDLGLIVNCPNGGNASIYLTPKSSLVSGSSTGMNLTKVGGNSAKKLPYVTVTGEMVSGDSICASNSGNAFKYNELNTLTNNSAKDFQQNLYFNLCANGEIIPGKYQGALDVEIMIE